MFSRFRGRLQVGWSYSLQNNKRFTKEIGNGKDTILSSPLYGKPTLSFFLSSYPALYHKDLQQELGRLYTALAELLRHFWSCFPVANKTLEDKLLRMKDTLHHFQVKKLAPFKESLARQHLQPNVSSVWKCIATLLT